MHCKKVLKSDNFFADKCKDYLLKFITPCSSSCVDIISEKVVVQAYCLIKDYRINMKLNIFLFTTGFSEVCLTMHKLELTANQSVCIKDHRPIIVYGANK